MKKFIKIIFLISFILLLTTCSTPFSGNDAVITINLGARSAWPHDLHSEIKDQLKFVATFSSDEHGKISGSAEFGATIRVTVSPGIWNIDLKAWHNENLYASSSGEDWVNVIAGQRARITIDMYLNKDYEYEKTDEPEEENKTKYSGTISNYDDFRGNLYDTSIYGITLFDEIFKIGNITQDGSFYFNLEEIKVNNPGTLYNLINNILNELDFSSDTDINIDRDIKAVMADLFAVISDYEDRSLFFGNNFTQSSFIYVDRPVTINQSQKGIIINDDNNECDSTIEWKLNLQKGWNIFYITEIREIDGNYITTISSSQPAYAAWMLVDLYEHGEVLRYEYDDHGMYINIMNLPHEYWVWWGINDKFPLGNWRYYDDEVGSFIITYYFKFNEDKTFSIEVSFSDTDLQIGTGKWDFRIETNVNAGSHSGLIWLKWD